MLMKLIVMDAVVEVVEEEAADLVGEAAAVLETLSPLSHPLHLAKKILSLQYVETLDIFHTLKDPLTSQSSSNP